MKKKRRKKRVQLDLHGKDKEELYDLLDRFLRENEGEEQVLVIVGKGRGVIKKEVLEYLEKTQYSWSYERVKGFENKGALLVDLL